MTARVLHPPTILHGAACHAAPFWPEGRALTLPGHGTVPCAPATVEAYAEYIAMHLPPRGALIGHSLGGMVALTLAARLGDAVKALVLVDTPLRLPLGPLHRLGMAMIPGLARAPRLIAEVICRRTSNRAARPAIRASIASMTPAGLRDAMRAALAFNGWPLLARVTCPVLAVWGQASLLTKQAEAAAIDALPAGRSVTYPGGHLVQFDHPDRFAADVTRFLEAHP
ncbi:MAG: alpha/beta hydrolase [Pseudomonadota bacterium]